MNSPSTKVRELTAIADQLKENKCAHYNYDEVLQHLRLKLAPPLPNISLQEEQTLEKLFMRVFYEEKCNPVEVVFQCSGCNYASLIRGVFMRNQYLGIISDLFKAFNSGEF